MKKIVVTGGHLTPALAVIKKLQAEGGWQILFIGRQHTMEGDKAASVESQVVPKTGAEFVSIQAGRFQRRLTRHFWPALLKIPLGFFQAFFQLRRFRPEVILSFGGYLALPVVFGGWLLQVPVITHDQSLTPGLANKLIALFAQKVAVSWPQTLKYFPQGKTVLTGNPIREEILQLRPQAALEPPLIYITGGNQGAHMINQAVEGCLPQLLEKYRLVHQVGTIRYYQDYQRLKQVRQKLPAPLKKRYRLGQWFDSWEVAKILPQASLVVSRAGANTLNELAFLAKPAIVIPLPLGQEQKENARFFAATGMIKVLPQEELTPQNLMKAIETLVVNLETYQTKAQQAKKLIKTDAAEKLIAEVKRCVS